MSQSPKQMFIGALRKALDIGTEEPDKEAIWEMSMNMGACPLQFAFLKLLKECPMENTDNEKFCCYDCWCQVLKKKDDFNDYYDLL